MPIERLFQHDISVVLAGEAGQGIETVEQVLMRTLKAAGYHVVAGKEYMSRVRGGTNTTEIRITSFPASAFVERIDLFLPLNPGAMEHVRQRLSSGTVIIMDEGQPPVPEQDTITLPLTKTALAIGNRLLSNTVATGFLTALFNIAFDTLAGQLKRAFGKKEASVLETNVEAARQGYALGQQVLGAHQLTIQLDRDQALEKRMIISGHEAVALGAAAGGCSFLASYPMSPSTGVLTFLAKYAGDLGIVVEQAEDEIAAINMGLGSWYAGGKAMVTTSGGGFALMSEGLSLAGAIESPMVIHLAQRPGPATGLPTRTEQGDLDLALYAGHGEFPRVILAPGNIEDMFVLSAKAFDLAGRYQVPVFILTDQALLDRYQTLAALPSVLPTSNYIIETTPDYKRYRLTENGLSPRGIPGWGKGHVCVDSDEHDESGHITESASVRKAMVDKRLRKMLLLADAAIVPEFLGPADYEKLIIGWGSTFAAIREAMAVRNELRSAYLYFKQVYPFSRAAIPLISKAKEVVCVENNATGQFAGLIRRDTGLTVHRQVLKYDGSPFSVEELVCKL